jgi:hypothetical protein
VISGSAKSNEAEEVASVISGSAKSDEAEEEGIAYLVIEDFALDEESKTPPPDPSRLEANRNQIEILGLMRTISNKNAATLDITCPLPSLFCQCAQWFIRLPDLVKKTLRNKKPPQPFVIFDIENACERYPGKSDKELEALSKEDLYKVDILTFCPTKRYSWVYNFSNFQSPGNQKNVCRMYQVVRRNTPATASSRQPQTTNKRTMAVASRFCGF